jgi:hypothetical protein
VLHRRQSEGKNAVKTPRAISAAPEAVERKKFLAPCPVERPNFASSGEKAPLRIKSPLLLKTEPPSFGAWSGSSRTNCFQYSGESRHTQLSEFLRHQSPHYQAAWPLVESLFSRSGKCIKMETWVRR